MPPSARSQSYSPRCSLPSKPPLCGNGSMEETRVFAGHCPKLPLCSADLANKGLPRCETVPFTTCHKTVALFRNSPFVVSSVNGFPPYPEPGRFCRGKRGRTPSAVCALSGGAPSGPEHSVPHNRGYGRHQERPYDERVQQDAQGGNQAKLHQHLQRQRSENGEGSG